MEKTCPICGKPLNFFVGKQPSADWEQRIEGAEPPKPRRSERRSKPVQKEPVGQPVQVLRDKTTGRAYIPLAALVAAGHNAMLLRPGHVFESEGSYWELDTFADIKPKRWWVAEIDADRWVAEMLSDFPEFTGPSSDDIVAYREGKHQVYFNPNTGEHTRG